MNASLCPFFFDDLSSGFRKNSDAPRGTSQEPNGVERNGCCTLYYSSDSVCLIQRRTRDFEIEMLMWRESERRRMFLYEAAEFDCRSKRRSETTSRH